MYKKKALSSVRELVPDIDDRAFYTLYKRVYLYHFYDFYNFMVNVFTKYTPN